MNNNRYSESLEDYLEAICLKGGEDVKSVELARLFNVSRASVNKAINTLIENTSCEISRFPRAAVAIINENSLI